jgi:hypothetical protein
MSALSASPEGFCTIPGSEILLVIEVAASSLAYDRGRKAALYARHGVREYRREQKIRLQQQVRPKLERAFDAEIDRVRERRDETSPEGFCTIPGSEILLVIEVAASSLAYDRGRKAVRPKLERAFDAEIDRVRERRDETAHQRVLHDVMRTCCWSRIFCSRR